MADKSNKLRARLPRGLADRGPAEIAATRRMLEAIRVVFERYGFEPVETPAIEYTDALGKFLPDQDRPNEGVFSFQDDDEQWLSLRYDLTAPLARYVAENFDTLPKPYRSYRTGWVFRNEKPGPGRFRQFMQFDADTVGSASPAADAEMCMLAADTMEALGVPRGSYVVKVNNRKVLDGVLECDRHRRRGPCRPAAHRAARDRQARPARAGRRAHAARRRAQRRERRLHQRRRLAGQGRRTGARLHRGKSRQRNRDAQQSGKRGGRLQASGLIGVDELRTIAALGDDAGYGDGRIVIDPSVVRGLEYYTGPVFEVDLTFEITNEDGRPVRFGSVGGGGRYDGLVARFRGEPVPATGFSIGVSRLQAALTHLGKIETKAGARPGGGHRVRPRAQPHRRLPAHGVGACAPPASARRCISAQESSARR